MTIQLQHTYKNNMDVKDGTEKDINKKHLEENETEVKNKEDKVTLEKVTKHNKKKVSKSKQKAEGLDKAAFQAKLKKLREKRKEIMRLNRQEVVEEDRLSKLPKNFYQRQERAEWKLNDIKKRKECEEKGIDYDQHKLLDISARDADKVERSKARKKNFDPGFSSKFIIRLFKVQVK